MITQVEDHLVQVRHRLEDNRLYTDPNNFEVSYMLESWYAAERFQVRVDFERRVIAIRLTDAEMLDFMSLGQDSMKIMLVESTFSSWKLCVYK
jgi:hypothetical protein